MHFFKIVKHHNYLYIINVDVSRKILGGVMKNFLLLIIVMFSATTFAQDWYSPKELISDLKSQYTSKDTTWEGYNFTPWFRWTIREQRAVFFNANNFGLEYPINLHALTTYLFDDNYDYDYKIYDSDGSTLLYEQRLNSIAGYNDHYLTTPLVLTNDFWVAIQPERDGRPDQGTSRDVENSHSYCGNLHI